MSIAFNLKVRSSAFRRSGSMILNNRLKGALRTIFGGVVHVVIEDALKQ
jgi:hypothetical protein